MKSLNLFLKYGFFIGVVFAFASCEPDEQGPEDFYVNDGFQVVLSAERTIGNGQYRARAESGDIVNIDVVSESKSDLTKLKITKTVNLEVDPTFGNNGIVEVGASGSRFEYSFSYAADTIDIDQLVGFTFEATNVAGEVEVSDLNLIVTLSPRDNLPRRRWALTSILHVNEGNTEVINDCEKDNSILLNADSTMVMDYGTDTGTGSCAFDGFNVYTKWYLSEDEKTFVWEYYGIFSPDNTVVETLVVKTLTTEQLGLELTVDLTVLGLGVETFLYIYEARPR